MMADYKRIHDPERTEHYVYRIYGRGGRLLYVGCSMNLRQRLAEHRRSHRLRHLIHAIDVEGPYNYSAGREIEREAIQAAEPPFNIEWTSRHHRGVAFPRRERVA